MSRSTTRSSRRRLAVVLAGAIGAAGALVAVPSPAQADSACTVQRTYGFRGVGVERAWASAVGSLRPAMVDTGSENYALAVTDRIAQYVQESIAGGCAPTVAFATRATTGGMGSSFSFFQGTATVGGGSASGSVTESGGHPLGDCHVFTCFAINDHQFPLGGPVHAGSQLTVTGSSTAIAIARMFTAYHQAHADWRIQFPVLRVPIP